MPATAEARDGAASSTVSSAAPAPGIFNFGEIDAGYYRGGELDGQDASVLATRGVRTVIDLRSDGDYDQSEAGLVEDAGMKYVRLPMTTRTAPTATQIADFLALVTDPASRPVYVHCVEGRHRTGVMTAVYRMAVNGWTPERAFDEMKDYKFGLDFLHPEFKRFVYAYRPEVPAVQARADSVISAAQ
jgi:protein tyrosine phosphatase (PTP) superfamily phosphohydrolase (DUF442 family)